MVDLSKVIESYLQSTFYYLMSKTKRNVTLLSKFLQKKINYKLCVLSLGNVKNQAECDTAFKISAKKIKELNHYCFHLLMPQTG